MRFFLCKSRRVLAMLIIALVAFKNQILNDKPSPVISFIVQLNIFIFQKSFTERTVEKDPTQLDGPV